VRVDLTDAAFEAGAPRQARLQQQLDALPSSCVPARPCWRIGYTAGADGEALARQRSRPRQDAQGALAEAGCCHTLLIEEELFLPPAAAGQGGKR